MTLPLVRSALPLVAALLISSNAAAQPSAGAPDFDALVAEHRAAIARLAWMDGVWRGTVVTNEPEGAVTILQTERIGAMASGTARLIEGRGFAEDGSIVFDAVAVVTYDAVADRYVMTSTARGMTGRPWFKATADGFEWGMENGPMKMSYVARLVEGEWIEEGFMAMADAPPRKWLTMRLKRVADTDWPAAGAIAAP